jgi:hypothetical protein
MSRRKEAPLAPPNGKFGPQGPAIDAYYRPGAVCGCDGCPARSGRLSAAGMANDSQAFERLSGVGLGSTSVFQSQSPGGSASLIRAPSFASTPAPAASDQYRLATSAASAPTSATLPSVNGQSFGRLSPADIQRLPPAVLRAMGSAQGRLRALGGPGSFASAASPRRFRGR